MGPHTMSAMSSSSLTVGGGCSDVDIVVGAVVGVSVELVPAAVVVVGPWTSSGFSASVCRGLRKYILGRGFPTKISFIERVGLQLALGS